MRTALADRRILVSPFVITILVLFSGCVGGTANQWALEGSGFNAVAKDFQGQGLHIAVLDSGIDDNHPALSHAPIIWTDLVAGEPNPYDDLGHGTHISGILVGRDGGLEARMNGYRLKGVAPESTLIVVKVIRGSDGLATATAVAAGIRFAIQNNADVICMSLGSNPALNLPIGEIQDAVSEAIGAGIVLVAAAGNYPKEGERPDDVAVPGRIREVVSVGAMDRSENVAEFSIRGNEEANHGLFAGTFRPDPHKKPEISAPGVGIRGAWLDGGYATASGTSQAAPFVCGAAALKLEQCPSLRTSNSSAAVLRIKELLHESAAPKGREGHDNGFGYGILRVDRLLELPC